MLRRCLCDVLVPSTSTYSCLGKLIQTHSSEVEIDEEVVRVLFEERDKAERLEEETNTLKQEAANIRQVKYTHLADQTCKEYDSDPTTILAECTFQELESVEADKRELIDAIEGESWLIERNELLAALEEEKDKTSTWQEERDTLASDLEEAQHTIRMLQANTSPEWAPSDQQDKADIDPAAQIQTLVDENRSLKLQAVDACILAQQFQDALQKAQNEQGNQQLRKALLEEKEKVCMLVFWQTAIKHRSHSWEKNCLQLLYQTAN